MYAISDEMFDTVAATLGKFSNELLEIAVLSFAGFGVEAVWL